MREGEQEMAATVYYDVFFFRPEYEPFVVNTRGRSRCVQLTGTSNLIARSKHCRMHVSQLGLNPFFLSNANINTLNVY